jgi:O-antigen/teichoic acid export membrane protein
MGVSIDYPLRKVVKGAVVALFGSVLGLFLVFLGRVIIARYLTVAEYGIFSLSFVILNILAVVSLMGLEKGITRQIAFFTEKKDKAKVGAIIRSSILITFVASLVCGIILFFLSDILATSVFQTPGLGIALKIFSFGLPFFTLLLLLVSIYRGFDRADVKFYFSDLLRNVFFVVFLGLSILFQLPLEVVLSGFVLSVAISCTGIIILYLRKPLTPSPDAKARSLRRPAKELLFFSMPLLVSALFLIVLSWTDTISLGYFWTVQEVGIYNAALPIAQFVPILLNGMAYIYLPVVSKLYSQNKLDEIRRMYVITTKWVFSLTYPLVLVVVLFPRPVLNLLFGADYVAGSTALQILVIGFFVHTFLGLNASTLLSLGETKYLMWSSIASSLVNIVLNVVLVLWLGIMGAAIATALSLILLNILISSKCYLGYRIHPFTRKYLSPILVSIPAILVIYLIVNLLVGVESVWLLPLFFVVFLVIYFVSILLTKGFDQEDLSMIQSIERRLGVDFKNAKRLLKRFL